MTRAELIAALEQATGPDAALDSAIACSIGLAQERDGFVYQMDPIAGSTHELFLHVPYTASIDAALTLVPGNSFVQLSIAPRDKRKLAVAYVTANDVNHQGGGDTPALALCVAALKARAARDA